MRCPACTQRNSVAARNCKFCGAKFKAKAPQIPFRLIGGIAVVGVVIAASSFVGSMFTGGSLFTGTGRPTLKLKPIAERMAAGPKTPEDAQLMRVDLDNAVVGYLEQNGSLPSSDLLTKLQSEVPSSAFEVLVFDLPNNIKLVELACVLQPSDYLVVPAKSGSPKVTRISGLSVFDAAHIVDAKPDPILILLGHTTGEKSGEPQFKAVSLLASGETTDKTDKLFPHLKGNGSAKFIGDDIEINRYVVSSAKDEKLFDKSVNFKDEPFKTTLNWKNGTYAPSVSLGGSEVGALYAVASSLVDPTNVDIYRQQLSSDVRDVIQKLEDKPVVAPGSFKITKVEKAAPSRRRRSRRSSGGGEGSATYMLASGTRGFEVGLAKSGRWSATSIKETEAPAASESVAETPAAETPAAETPAVAEKPVEEIPVVETPPEPKIVERKSEKSTDTEPTKADKGPTKVDKEPTKVATISGTEDSDNKRKKNRESAESREKQDRAETETASSSRRGVSSETIRKVTMRSGPARQFGSVTNIGVGVPVRILAERDHWLKISVDGKEGWVYSSYVKRAKSASNVASKPDDSEPGPSKRDRKKESKVASSEPSSKKSKSSKSNITATTSSVDSGKKSGKYKSQISSSKAHTAPKEASDEPDFVP